MDKMVKYSYNMPVGTIGIYEKENKICAVRLADIQDVCEEKETPLIKETAQQLKEYFAGSRKEFTLPLLLEGTDFQIKVWQALTKIPYGETRSYKQIAQNIGNPKAQRAVGGANNKNKILIIIPCHRVTGANGSLTGYACGIDIKRYLLNLEGVNI